MIGRSGNLSDGLPPCGEPPDNDQQNRRITESEELLPFNPLDTRNLAAAVVKALLERRAWRFGDLSPFKGAGIYAIYYGGNYPAYEAIAAVNHDRQWPRWPIYVGKAIPEGARRGKIKVAADGTNSLFNRLRQHRESIQSAANLGVEDFSCRFLIVHDLWIPLAEQLLIAHFAPVWNRIIDGFGNHDPGSGRYQGLCPRWDVLHPGRGWAPKLKRRPETAADIEREVRQYLAGAAVPSLNTLSGDYSAK